MVNETANTIDGNINWLLDAITYGRPDDATFNEKLWAENTAYDLITFATRHEARVAFASWSGACDEV